VGKIYCTVHEIIIQIQGGVGVNICRYRDIKQRIYRGGGNLYTGDCSDIWGGSIDNIEKGSL
jgi:hypothetical protein